MNNAAYFIIATGRIGQQRVGRQISDLTHELQFVSELFLKIYAHAFKY